MGINGMKSYKPRYVIPVATVLFSALLVSNGILEAQAGYYLTGVGYSAQFNEKGAILSFEPEGSSFSMNFAGSNPGVTVKQKEGTVVYENIYPGIDLVFNAGIEGLKYEFIVWPGSNPQAVRIEHNEAHSLEIKRGRELVVRSANGQLADRELSVYQEIEGARVSVEGGFRILGGSSFGFDVAGYDKRFPLIIDPVLEYSTYVAGSGDEVAGTIARDISGNAYIAGSTSSTNFPGLNPYQGSNLGFGDVFVTKLDPSGENLLFSTYLGGSFVDFGIGIAVDSPGNIYVTGRTFSGNFPTASPYQGTLNGPDDAYLTKFSYTGSTLIYSTYLGGSNSDQGDKVAVNPSGYAFITGRTSSTNFPTQNAYQGTFAGGANDVIATMFQIAGNSLQYSTYLGGSGDDGGLDITLDYTYTAHLTGYTNSPNFPTSNPWQGTNGGAVDAFAANMLNVPILYYSTYLGGSGLDYGYGIAVDTTNSPYVVGITNSVDFPVSSFAYQGTLAGGNDAFCTSFVPSGSILMTSTYLGGGGFDAAYDVDLDGYGYPYLTGRTESSDFPTLNAFQGTRNSTSDAFVTRMGPGIILNSIRLYFSTYLGGGGDEDGHGITVEQGGNAYIAGLTTSGNFPTLNPYMGTSPGLSDAFVTKLSIEEATVGVYRPSTRQFLLRNTNSSGTPDHAFVFGASGDLPLAGDWNGDGNDSTGVYRPSTRQFFLRDSNSAGPADYAFVFGASGDLPVAGDWDGNGSDSIGTYRPGTRQFFLRNSLSAGAADGTVTFGASGDQPLTGEWTWFGFDSIGVYRPSTRQFFLKYVNSPGPADTIFVFGASGDTPVRGDWKEMLLDTAGVRRPSSATFYLRNSNSAGAADITFTYGTSADKPIMGDWDGR